MFAAIYHPVGIPMVIDTAVNRGRTMALNGVCGNIGVSVAAGITARITVYHRLARGVLCAGRRCSLVTGIAYLMLVPNDRKRQVAAPDRTATSRSTSAC